MNTQDRAFCQATILSTIHNIQDDMDSVDCMSVILATAVALRNTVQSLKQENTAHELFCRFVDLVPKDQRRAGVELKKRLIASLLYGDIPAELMKELRTLLELSLPEMLPAYDEQVKIILATNDLLTSLCD